MNKGKLNQDVSKIITSQIERYEKNWERHGINDMPDPFDIVNEFLPKIPTRYNTYNQYATCPFCHTLHSIAQQRDGHCPFCWRLI